MFGKEFSNQTYILKQSLEQMGDAYKKMHEKENYFLSTIQKAYISLFGIPEIGFQIRSIYFKNILSSYLKANLKKIFDAGSGIGAHTFWLAKNYPHSSITGGDIDKNKLKSSSILANQLDIKNVTFMYFDLRKVPKKSSFDLIVCIDVLEHIHNYKKVLRNFYLLLQKNGYVYLHVPQSNQKRIFKYLGAWHHQDHKHKGLDKKSLKSILDKIGFKIITVQETFGFFGKLAWEINHISLSKSFIVAGMLFPLLYVIASLDKIYRNYNGLGIAILAQKIK